MCITAFPSAQKVPGEKHCPKTCIVLLQATMSGLLRVLFGSQGKISVPPLHTKMPQWKSSQSNNLTHSYGSEENCIHTTVPRKNHTSLLINLIYIKHYFGGFLQPTLANRCATGQCRTSHCSRAQEFLGWNFQEACAHLGWHWCKGVLKWTTVKNNSIQICKISNLQVIA